MNEFRGEVVLTRTGWLVAAAAAALLVGACAGGEKNADTTAAAAAASGTATPPAAATTPAGSTSAAAPAPAESGAAAGGAAPGGAAGGAAAGGGAAAAGGGGTPKITAAMVSEGNKIFHGQAAGGTCFTCHGQNAEGTPLAPPLKKGGSAKWISIDGSYGAIVNRVQTGMPTPTAPYVAPMPPMGGANLTADQVHAVAAYVYSLNHPDVGKS